MDFSLSQEQLEIKTLAEKILTECAGEAQQKKIDNSGQRFDKELWQVLADAGLLGIALDAHHGGLGLTYAELCMLFEEVGRAVAPVPVIPVLVTALCLQRYGRPDQKAYLPTLAQGKFLLSAALFEHHNERSEKVPVEAQLKNGRWFVSGQKLCVPIAKDANRILMSANSDQGLIVFLLDPTSDKVKLTPMQNTAQEPQYLVEMQQAEIAAQDILSSDNALSQQIIFFLTQHMTAAYCAMQTGLADKVMRMTASYTAEREQFGVPVATFQAVGHKAANCYIDVYCQRLVTQQAISLLSEGVDAQNEVHIAKIWAGDCGHRVSYAAQHLHGGVGIDKDYPLWRYCLWMRHIELILGSSTHHLASLGKALAS